MVELAIHNDASLDKIDIKEAKFLNYFNVSKKKELQDCYQSSIINSNSKMTNNNTLMSIPKIDKASAPPSTTPLKYPSKSPVKSQSNALFLDVKTSTLTTNTISRPNLSSLARSSSTKYVFTLDDDSKTNNYKNGPLSSSSPPSIEDLVNELKNRNANVRVNVDENNITPPNDNNSFPSDTYSYLSKMDRSIVFSTS